MAKTICQSVSNAGVTSTANTTQYWPIAGFNRVSTTEANQDTLFRNAGVFSNLLVEIYLNSVAATSTFTLRKNAGDITQVLSIGSSATGTFEDTTHTDTIAAGDKICLKTIPGAASGTYNIYKISIIFAATTDTVTKLCASNFTFATASTTTFMPLAYGGPTTTEANHKCRMRKAASLKNMAVHISGARAQTTTVRSRKNGADGTLVVSCTGGATGWFEDTTHTDTVTAAEDWNYSITNGTGVDTLTVDCISTEFVSTNGDGLCIVAEPTAGFTVADATVLFFGIASWEDRSTTEANIDIKARVAFDVSELTWLVTANDVSSASTGDFRVGAASSTLTVSITGSTTGVFSDSTHTVTIAATDLINTRLSVPSVSGSHNVTVRNVIFNTHLTTNANLTTSITETVSISDSIARVKGANRPITETVNSTESIARLAVNSRPLSTETTTISDSIARVKGNVRPMTTETIAVSDSIARLYGATRALPETVVSSDSVARLYGANRALSTETIAISDSIARVKGVARTIVETISSSDSLARLYAAARALTTETVSSSDSVARLLGAIRALTTETTAISDSIQRVKGVARSISETVNLSDSIARVFTGVRALPETVASSDSLTRLFAGTRAIGETVSNSDSIAKVLTLVRALPESVTSSDSIARLLASSRVITENTTITGTVARLLAAMRTLTESTSVSDSIATLFTPGAPGNNFVRAITETVNLSESIARRVTNTRALPETTSISDQLTRIKGAIRSLSETVNLSDSITRLVSGIRTLPETINLSDSIQRVFSGTRTIAESVTSSSSVVTLRGVVRTLTENIAVSDSLTRVFDGIRTLAESVNLSDILQSLYSSAHAILGLATGEVSTTEKIEGKGPTNLRVYHIDIDIDRVPEPERDIQPSTVSESHGRVRRRYINDPDLE